MLGTLFLKIALTIGLGLVSFAPTSPWQSGADFAAAHPAAAETYNWKYVAPEWVAPSPNLKSQFKADYLAPQAIYGAGHRGVDFKSSIGEVLRSPFSGTVVESARVGFRDVVTLKDSRGRLASFEPVCASVSLGSRVNSGQSFGKTCTPGIAYTWHCALCVHFSARIGGLYVSPLVLTGDFRPSVIKRVTS